MKAPKFWNKGSGSILQQLLRPLSAVYVVIDRMNRARVMPQSVSIPVICVGNAVAGGAGKTPVSISIARFLIAKGWKVHFLSRGYGGSYKGPTRVVPDVHGANEVGDEPLILANTAPTWISQDRVIGAKAAVEAGAEVIIMDDGFQNPSLHKDISFLVVDGGYGLGNGSLLPAGPLRETWGTALGRADAVIVVDPSPITSDLNCDDKPKFNAQIVPLDLQTEIVGQKVIAFAGIGRPEKFFKSLQNIGADVIESVEFSDHHKFSQDDIMKLVERAANLEAALVTTRKDYVRLSPEAKLMTTVFDIDLTFEKPQRLQTLLAEKLGDREHV
ncbi:tetraacyldisaccharide 4'-kinase [Sneathiella sp. P13V-1]|uniref:tetraacyldisaccharide 4'-kinase n=1 Tax=Sneathiella sp. P13V-1 TaxID=2697366 RepID=UPI00187B2200|nr:tetraacyldisaccharide 4'-kinase [Sneathiella sp. P13V-1]MBE7636827.1 tetraacyldisaccharide 4'-kinase [Sneathiella sp. P13V-1]